MKIRAWTLHDGKIKRNFRYTFWQIFCYMPISHIYAHLKHRYHREPEYKHPRHKWTLHDGENTHYFKNHLMIVGFCLLLSPLTWAQTPTNYDGSLDAQSFKTIVTSTASCSSTVIVLLSTNTARVGNLICNEDTAVAVRIGPSTISSTVGQYLGPGNCMTYDKPRYYRGSIWCISTGAAVKVSATEGTP